MDLGLGGLWELVMDREAWRAAVHVQSDTTEWLDWTELWFISLAFHMMYSAYKLNKQGDNIQPWHTPLPILNQSAVLCLVLTAASWPAHRFLSRQVRWSGIPISLRIFHSCCDLHKGFSIVNEAEVDVFLEFPCFWYDPMNIGNLISGPSAFSKSSFYIWKFSVHVLLKPSLKDFEHYLAGMWNEHNCAVVWTFFGTAFLWDWLYMY